MQVICTGCGRQAPINQETGIAVCPCGRKWQAHLVAVSKERSTPPTDDRQQNQPEKVLQPAMA